MKEYRKPKNIPVEKGSGYPEEDIGMDDVWVKGRFMKGTKRKVYKTMRGGGAAERGKKFWD